MRRLANSGLKTYRAKRDFGVTAEPKGKIARKRGSAFVIQKHDATRLHYDLRLELDGVMKSWAVTRGPKQYHEHQPVGGVGNLSGGWLATSCVAR